MSALDFRHLILFFLANFKSSHNIFFASHTKGWRTQLDVAIKRTFFFHSFHSTRAKNVNWKYIKGKEMREGISASPATRFSHKRTQKPSDIEMDTNAKFMFFQ